MSRRITIATKMDDESLVEKSLEELETNYTREGDWFRIKSAEGQRFMYTGAGINAVDQEVAYDEDDRRAKSFVQDRLFQIYNKNKVMETMITEGHEVTETYTADSGTYIEGFDDIIEEGDIVVRSRASF